MKVVSWQWAVCEQCECHLVRDILLTLRVGASMLTGTGAVPAALHIRPLFFQFIKRSFCVSCSII